MLQQTDWEFWGVVIAVVGFLASTTWALRERRRRRKDLYYAVISKAPLVSVSEEAEGRIKILFDEKPVSNVSLAIIQIVNRGSPIPSGDFESPLTIFMGCESQIMSVEVIVKQPDSLDVASNIENGKIQIEPLLLNNGDFFTLKVIGTNLAENIEVAARILGVKELTSRASELARRYRRQKIITYSQSALFAIGGVLLLARGLMDTNTELIRLGGGLTAVGVVALVLAARGWVLD